MRLSGHVSRGAEVSTAEGRSEVEDSIDCASIDSLNAAVEDQQVQRCEVRR